MSATPVITVIAAGACSLLLVMGCADSELVCAAAGSTDDPPDWPACSYLYMPPPVLTPASMSAVRRTPSTDRSA